MWLLQAGRVSGRELFPSALATAICRLAMSIVFKLTMSSTIVSNYAKYGALGVMFSLMSFLIAVGVVIIVGAIIGLVWRLRRTADQPAHQPDEIPTAVSASAWQCRARARQQRHVARVCQSRCQIKALGRCHRWRHGKVRGQNFRPLTARTLALLIYGSSNRR